jgi:hypothetical protein
MHPIRILSFGNGWQHLITYNSSEWHDIEASLNELTPEVVLDPHSLRGILGSARQNRAPHIHDISLLWSRRARRRGWRAISAPSKNGILGFRIATAKNGVAARMITVDSLTRQELPGYLLITGPRALSSGACEVLIVLVPSDDYIYLYDENSRILSESICRAQLSEISSLISNTPIVIVFFSPQSIEFEVEEVPILHEISSAPPFIERSIEFAPEYYQAGVGILSYFGEVLRKKHPDINAKVRIEQEGTTVRMHVETPTGDIEIIEKELQKYALVVAEQAPPEAMYDNAADVLELKLRLKMAQLEIENKNDLLELTHASHKKEVSEIKKELRAYGR